jgi:hypothetical protein
VRGRVNTIYATLDPVLLLKDIRAAQAPPVEVADRPATAETTAPSAPTIEQSLSGLRTVWQEEEFRGDKTIVGIDIVELPFRQSGGVLLPFELLFCTGCAGRNPSASGCGGL